MEALCLLAAFFAPLILEKMDILMKMTDDVHSIVTSVFVEQDWHDRLLELRNGRIYLFRWVDVPREKYNIWLTMSNP